MKTSGIMQRFAKVATDQARLTRAERDAMFQKSVGQERVVLALLSRGLRRIEILRMLVGDITPDQIAIRGKGYYGGTSRHASLNDTVRRELEWYLPLRAQWAETVTEDTGHLLCWRNGSRLQGYSSQSVDRLIRSSGSRIGKHVTCHMLRRTAADLLRERGATVWEIQWMLGHRSVATTEIYLERLDVAGKLAHAASLLGVPVAWHRRAYARKTGTP
jgi:site-specific recombinase XerD